MIHSRAGVLVTFVLAVALVVACDSKLSSPTAPSDRPLYGVYDSCTVFSGAKYDICYEVMFGVNSADPECDDMRSYLRDKIFNGKLYAEDLPGSLYGEADIGYETDPDGPNTIAIDTTNNAWWKDSLAITLRHEYLHTTYGVPNTQAGNDYADSVGRVWCY